MNTILHKIAFEIKLYENIYRTRPTYVIMSKATYDFMCMEYTHITQIYGLKIIICDNYKYGDVSLGAGV